MNLLKLKKLFSKKCNHQYIKIGWGKQCFNCDKTLKGKIPTTK